MFVRPRKRNPKRRIEEGEIPHDLTEDILVNLPVKSLISFKCVCRSWSSLVSNPSFAEPTSRSTSVVRPHNSLILERDNGSADLVENDSLDKDDISQRAMNWSPSPTSDESFRELPTPCSSREVARRMGIVECLCLVSFDDGCHEYRMRVMKEESKWLRLFTLNYQYDPIKLLCITKGGSFVTFHCYRFELVFYDPKHNAFRKIGDLYGFGRCKSYCEYEETLISHLDYV